ncbi:MAG: 3-alpha,7-alpha, 12-alpha-trihydroxy-5-beta-cholest-24-enoyl-CoAhydratase [Deltaproteobacteria bacterium]|nr:3-alpha,7-alpha, 12-alpha-trihydroxy-5-beta-cholest-24-enoyl-CoAhydratase [Deltaproteobacteria bacterium]
MSQRKISSDLVGMTFAPVTFSWTWKEVILYALGVGAKPEGDLDYVFEGKGPKVLPTFAVIPGMVGGSGLSQIEINLVWDKGKAAVIVTETAAEDDNGPMFTTRSTLFIRGAGGFGGERGPSTAGLNVPPERQPDHVVEDVTRPEQGAIYRLSGDFNPLHIDPDFAKMAGFDKPIVHGLCTYGFAGRAILRVLCGGEPSRFESFDARFADNVYFGDTIITKIWRTGAGEAIVQAETQKGNVVLAQAKATYKE